MTTALKETLREVEKLSDVDQDHLAAVLRNELKERAWDLQIERDSDAGKFDALIEQGLKEFRAGQTKPLP